MEVSGERQIYTTYVLVDVCMASHTFNSNVTVTMLGFCPVRKSP